MWERRLNQQSDGHAIQRPGRRLLAYVKLDFVRERAHGGGRRSVNESLNLTAFIDFLIVVVVFLLMTFTANGDVGDPRVELPEAEHGIELLEAPVVVVSESQVLVNGDLADGTTNAAADVAVRKLPELFERLAAIKRQWASFNPYRAFPGLCLLQIDEAVPAHLVKSVFYTATLAGYPDVSFVVRRR